nr:MAG TPA: C2H2 type zinc-finger protein [Bacteriophage sp.]
MIKRKNGTLHWLDLDITQSPWSVIRCPHCGYR